jgi:hypothetical protein
VRRSGRNSIEYILRLFCRDGHHYAQALLASARAGPGESGAIRFSDRSYATRPVELYLFVIQSFIEAHVFVAVPISY